MAATEYAAAASADDPQRMLDAVEELHARYERAGRVIRPAMKELDAYHQVLYRIYHTPMPAARLSELPPVVAELGAACTTLAAAPVPKRFAAKESLLKASFAELCAATQALAAAVEVVHTAYQKAEKLFD